VIFINLCRLLTNEGSLLAFSGESEKQAKVTGAIACNIWSTYEKHGKSFFDNDSMNCLILQNEVCFFFFFSFLFLFSLFFLNLKSILSLFLERKNHCYKSCSIITLFDC